MHNTQKLSIVFLAVLITVGSYILLFGTSKKTAVKVAQLTDTFTFSSSNNIPVLNEEISRDNEVSQTLLKESDRVVEILQVTPEDTTHTLLQKLSENGCEDRNLLQVLWIRAADGNITKETLLVFENVKDESSDPELSSFASMVLKDLKRLQKIRSGELSEEVALNNTLNYIQLEEQLLSSNESTRNKAVTQLGNNRSTTAVVLLKAQLNDPSPQIRLDIVESLWRMAADGFDAEHDLTYTLQEMMTDEDEAVSQAAILAVKDLIRLQKSN